MKALLFSILFFVSVLSFSQTVSTMRMGDFKLGMTTDELSSLIHKKIEFTSDKNDYELKKMTISYQEINYEILFMEMYDDKLDRSVDKVFAITTYNPKIKTLSKIGVGNTLDDLWSVYKNYTFNLYKKWDEKTEQYSKNDRIFQLLDINAYTSLIFTIKNNKIISVSVSYYDEGC